jgi:hypothetical protein
MAKGRTKHAKLLENILVVKKGIPPLFLGKGLVLPIQTEDRGSGCLVLQSDERCIAIPSRSVSLLSPTEDAEYRTQMVMAK